jgi:hypothetical protein
MTSCRRGVTAGRSASVTTWWTPPREDAMEATSLNRHVAAARQSLDNARADLDAAVAILPDVEGGDAMATPNLVALLLRAVRAKDRLSELEILVVAEAEGHG